MPSDSENRFQVFFDGACPLCRREIDWLRKRDRDQQIEFVDIADPSFDEQRHGRSYETLMTHIHGRETDGRWVTGVDVFRRLYQAAGFGPLVRLSRLPLVKQLLDLAYRFFARYRTRLTGRCHAGGDSCQVGTDPPTQAANKGEQPDNI
ncbi:MAG: DUF393 domain-containing protein [Mariniblastus sp.]|nr:DUF393 domain-containing protein [Mariniblastus sp.]